MLRNLLSSETNLLSLFAVLMVIQLIVLIFAIVMRKESLWITFFLILLGAIGLVFLLCNERFSFLGAIVLSAHIILFFIALAIRAFFMAKMPWQNLWASIFATTIVGSLVLLAAWQIIGLVQL